MRPNHQNNKRMRGRNRPNGSGGGKGPNPLTRSYESNGPDVKIRGTAQHVAEKYVQLGRDAQATGDHVAAESYFQHAEHYFRLIAAAQEVFRQQNPQYRPYETSGDQDDDGEDEPPFGQGSAPSEPRFPAQSAGGEGDEQPRQPYAPQQRDYQPREPREFQPREPRGEQRDYQPRERRDFQPREAREFQPREPREFQPRETQPREQREPRDYQPRDNRGPREPRFPREPRAPAPDAAAPDAALPAFITAPVRTLPGIADETAPAEVLTPVNGEEAGAFPLRARRRRGRPPRVEGGEAAAPDDAPAGE